MSEVPTDGVTHKETVLVVDDDEITRRVFQRALERAGLAVRLAPDGATALRIASSEPVDIALVDLRMPGLDGLEVVAALRRRSSARRVPIVLVTAVNDVGERVRGLELGADDYLTKPVEPDELVARVRAHLRRDAAGDCLHWFVESLNDAFVAWDAGDLIVEWNARAEALLGWSKSEVLGRSFTEVVLAARHRVAHRQRMLRFFATGQEPLLGEWVELTGAHRDGHEIPIEITMWSAGNDELRLNAFIRSRAHRHEIEEALRASARLQSLVDASPDMITLEDRSGTIVYMSPSVHTVLGYENDELVGRTTGELLHLDDRARFELLRLQVREATMNVTDSFRLCKHDGSYVWAEASAAALRDPGTSDLTAIETIWRDISLRKLAEAQRERAAAQLADSNRGLREAIAREQQMVEELQRLDRVKSDFVANVSHELRTPLASIRGYVELLSDHHDDELTPSQRDMLRVIERNAGRLLQLIDDLLTIGSTESGGFEVALKPLELEVVVRESVDALRPTARERGIELYVANAPNVGLVLGDPDQLDRALLNLLSNALKFTPEGGRVDVRATRENGMAAVTVRDTGIGIPLAEQAKLFTPFFRSSLATQRAIPGTGLGLVVVKGIAEAHGGSVRVESPPGEGVAVVLELPAAPDEARHADPSTADQEERSDGAHPHRR